MFPRSPHLIIQEYLYIMSEQTQIAVQLLRADKCINQIISRFSQRIFKIHDEDTLKVRPRG